MEDEIKGNLKMKLLADCVLALVHPGDQVYANRRPMIRVWGFHDDNPWDKALSDTVSFHNPKDGL